MPEKNEAAAPAEAKTTAPAAAAAQPQVEPPVLLNEFMVHLSRTERRVEMLNAFYASEKAANHLSAQNSEYQKRWVAFMGAVPKRGTTSNRRRHQPARSASQIAAANRPARTVAPVNSAPADSTAVAKK